MSTNTKTASDLVAGRAFRKVGKRKWRIAQLVDSLPDGRILVCLADCSQVVLDRDEEVEVPTGPQELDACGFAKLGRRRAAENRRRRGEFR